MQSVTAWEASCCARCALCQLRRLRLALARSLRCASRIVLVVVELAKLLLSAGSLLPQLHARIRMTY